MCGVFSSRDLPLSYDGHLRALTMAFVVWGVSGEVTHAWHRYFHNSCLLREVLFTDVGNVRSKSLKNTHVPLYIMYITYYVIHIVHLFVFVVRFIRLYAPLLLVNPPAISPFSHYPQVNLQLPVVSPILSHHIFCPLLQFLTWIATS